MTPEITCVQHQRVELGVQGGQLLGGAHHWLRHAQLLGQGLSAEELAAIFAVEKVSHEGPDGARVRGRAEGEEEEREIESCRVPLACGCGTGRGAREPPNVVGRRSSDLMSYLGP